MGIVAVQGEAPASYMERAQNELGGKPVLSTLGKALCISRYSPYRLARVQVERAQRTYRQLLERLTPLQRLRLYWRRLLHGLR